jgi:transposase
MVREVITVEDWAEIRRPHRAEGLPIKEIVRQTGLARNTVRTALRSSRPPRYERPARGSVVDAYEPAIRALLGGLAADAGPGDRPADQLAALDGPPEED